MADIFISYSQADRTEVAKLAAYLESEGWSVWFDKNLSAGELYRDEIMRELVAARAVLVLWTKTSTRSDFVRAEAGRAKAECKLIPIKASDVTYGEIPLPFGEIHTESLSNLLLIRGAILAQLAKPAAEASPLRVASSALKYQVLTWFGIVGAAVTVFSSASGFLNLAAWAHWLVENWHKWTLDFWRSLIVWLGVEFPTELTPMLSIALFSLVSATGARHLSTETSNKHKPELKPFVVWALSIIVAVVTLTFLWRLIPQLVWYDETPFVFLTFLLVVAVSAYFARNRGAFILFLFLYALLFIAIVGPMFDVLDSYVVDKSVKFTGLNDKYPWLQDLILAATVVVSMLPVLLFPLLMVWICPLHALNKRLLFIAIGFCILASLNEVSKYAGFIKASISPPN